VATLRPQARRRPQLYALSLHVRRFSFSDLALYASAAGNRSQHHRSSGHTARTSGYTASIPFRPAEAKRPLMTQHSEERIPETEGEASVHAGARILPFERPQSELQRAIQQRAQQALDLDRERETRRPQPLKWLAIFALACIPVLLTFTAVDGFVRVFQKIAATYATEPAVQQQTAPSEPEAAPQPGVVMLQSYDVPSGTQRTATPPGVNSSASRKPTEAPARR
jgi:hypothetical protein